MLEFGLDVESDLRRGRRLEEGVDKAQTDALQLRRRRPGAAAQHADEKTESHGLTKPEAQCRHGFRYGRVAVGWRLTCSRQQLRRRAQDKH